MYQKRVSIIAIQGKTAPVSVTVSPVRLVDFTLVIMRHTLVLPQLEVRQEDLDALHQPTQTQKDISNGARRKRKASGTGILIPPHERVILLDTTTATTITTVTTTITSGTVHACPIEGHMLNCFSFLFHLVLVFLFKL